ncbi:MAG: beta-lactamase family protein, partial [Pedosphaera parvula]|nr:beta-lactamase family protein [Pedosphaera parvula]
MRKFLSLALLAVLLALPACKTAPTGVSRLDGILPPLPPPVAPAKPPVPTPAPVFHAAKLGEIDAAIEQAIADHKLPGGVLWLERLGARYHKAYGQRALVPSPESMTEDTLFDAASLTKVIACTPAIMLLAEWGQIRLDDSVSKYIPEFAAH